MAGASRVDRQGDTAACWKSAWPASDGTLGKAAQMALSSKLFAT
jgi:hypothetical protein